MLEIIFEILFGVFGIVFDVVGDVILQVILEAVAEFGCAAFENPWRPAKSANPFFAACGLLLLGGLLGLLLGLVLPNPLFHHRPLPGISLALAPLGVGALMQVFGVWRRKKGGHPTCLATFWGGACFAFGMALVRWLIVTHT